MWSIQLLGGLSAHDQQRQVSHFRTQKAASLLASLAFHRASQPRETLIEMLWPEIEPEVGRHNLSMALSFLRHRLEPPGVPPGTVILADRIRVQLNPEAVTIDVHGFEQAAHRALSEKLSPFEQSSLLQQAADLYTGPLLPGYFEEWIGPEALRLESLFAQVVNLLVPLLLRSGRQEAALEYAQRALRADPLSEEAVRQVLQALAALGQSAQVLRVYRAFTQRLQEQLDVAPSEALQNLVRQLGDSSLLSASSALPESAPPIQGTGNREQGTVGQKGRREEGREEEVNRKSRIENQKSSGAAATPPSTPRGRLQGSEFLLRTTTRFLGREAEITRLSQMLTSPHTRLLTLMGPGGIGKTRLALEAAARLVESSEGEARSLLSAVFIPLADIDEPGRLFEVILRTMGLVPAAELAPLDQLIQVLASQPATLFLLDNFEQLVEDGALLVRELLARAANVKLLVTSRQKLDLEGERAFHLAPLPTPFGKDEGGRMKDESDSIHPSSLLSCPSIGLFVDRAQAVRSDFQLTERNAAAVAQLCERLEGMPLAIELAAARVASHSPAKILEQIQTNRLDFLATHKRDTASRQRTLRATLDWSYHLLPPTGQAFLMQLSVFRGGWTLEAAEAVCEVKQGETLQLLMLLRDSSLIGVVDTQEGLRFTMLETIRQYSREKLQESGESESVMKRHCDFFLALAEEAELHLTGSEQALWLQRLEAEHENLRAALEWSLNAGEREKGKGEREEEQAEQSKIENRKSEIALRLVAALWRFWWVRGRWNAARTYVREALQLTATIESTPTRAKALYGAGVLAHSQGAFRAAAALFEQSLALYRESADRRGMAAALNGLGNVAQELGDMGAARAHHAESLALYRELGDQEGAAVSLDQLGHLAVTLGEYAAAQALLEESLALRQELKDRRGVGDALSSLGFAAKEQGDYAAARELYEQSMAVYSELGDRSRQALSRHTLGLIAEHEGDLASARRLYEECLAIFIEVGDQIQVVWTQHGLGYLAYRQGDFMQAHRLLADSLLAFREMEHTIGLVRSLDRYAGLAAAQGQMERAGRLLGAAAALRASAGIRPSLVEQQETEREVSAVRSELDTETFAAVWAEGWAMTLERAVEYALEEIASA